MKKWLRRIGVALIVTAAIAAGGLLLSPKAEPHAFNDHESPLSIAHQGGDRVWPGNTMFAFERAAELGVDCLEMDLHLSADGEIVVIHDDSVDRTTDGEGPVAGMTVAELKAFDAGHDWMAEDGSHPFRGQGIQIPTLREVFEAFPDMRMVVEIKPPTPEMVPPLGELIREYERADRTMVGSFHADNLEVFRDQFPDAATSLGRKEVRLFYLLQRIFLAGFHAPPGQALQVPETHKGRRIVSDSFVSAAHERGMKVHVWTVDDAEDMRRLLAMGVDGIITDRPDRLMEVLGEEPES
jgi:glycerophosphoryl diester phosphodiesterase